MNKTTAVKALFGILAAASLTPWTPPWLALIAGIAFALTLGNPFADLSKKASKSLLQICVVLLGFSVDLKTVLQAGSQGLVFALASITCVFLLGWGLGKLLGVRSITSLLVSTGTAICGGSAIAAMSTVMDAPQEDVSVSVGTVFLLNAIALLVFPPLGNMLHLTQTQFGTWAGIAIHDIASVVGAGKSFDGLVGTKTDIALTTATAVKLSRVLYLIPITLIAAFLRHRENKGAEAEKKAPVQIPWFIGGFLLASLLRSYVRPIADQSGMVKIVATCGLALALYLIGSGITRKTLKAVGVRPLIEGVILWIFISLAGFGAVVATVH